MPDEILRFFSALGSTLLWSVVSIVIVAVVFEILNKRYKLMNEIFDENSTAAAIGTSRPPILLENQRVVESIPHRPAGFSGWGETIGPPAA